MSRDLNNLGPFDQGKLMNSGGHGRMITENSTYMPVPGILSLLTDDYSLW